MDEQNVLQNLEPQPATKLKHLKKVSTRLGIVFLVYFLIRIILGVFGSDFLGLLPDIGITAKFGIGMLIETIGLYLIPIILALLLLDDENEIRGNLRGLYKKPNRVIKKIAVFPAMYGLGQLVNFLTLIVMHLLSKLTESTVDPIDSVNPLDALPPNLASGIIYAFMLVIVAPLFEEFLLRGIVMNALNPFGYGFSIVVSSVIFGLMHGNVQMLFYTTILGFSLGYVRYATGSIFITTILHAFVNALAAIATLFMTHPAIRNNLYPSRDFVSSPTDEMMISLFSIYMLIFFAIIIVGIFLFFKRIPTIRKYRVQHIWTEVSTAKKYGVLLSTVTIILMLIFSIDAQGINLVNNLLVQIMGG